MVREQRHRHTVEVTMQVDVSELEERGHNVRVTCRNVGGRILRDNWSADEEWDVDVFLKSACLARIQAVLPNVIAIVCCLDDAHVAHQVETFQFVENRNDEIVHSGKWLQALPMVVIVVRKLCIIKLWDLSNPGCSRRTVRVEVRISRDLDPGIQVFVTIGWDKRLENWESAAINREDRLRMRCNRHNTKEGGSIILHCVVEEFDRLLCNDVGRVLPLVVLRRLAVACHNCVVVHVGGWVSDKVAAVPAPWIWDIVVVRLKSIHELASVVGLVSGVLKP